MQGRKSFGQCGREKERMWRKREAERMMRRRRVKEKEKRREWEVEKERMRGWKRIREDRLQCGVLLNMMLVKLSLDPIYPMATHDDNHYLEIAKVFVTLAIE